MNKDFKIHIPIELIKGKDKSGAATMKIRGIGSTPSLDADGEYLDPKGFQSDYFLKHGFMNWNHQTNNDPSSIVGRPTSANVKGKDYVIGFDLFPESKKAQQVFELQQVLETQGLALGLSIEGKVVERDANNKSKVTKALITGCAITPNPKNRDTVAEIIKGNTTYSALVDEDENEDDDEDKEEEKSMSAGSSSGQALALESLNSDTKTLAYKKKIKKGDILEKISRDLPLINNQMVSTIYDLTTKIQKAMDNAKTNNEVPEVTVESLEKAYEILGLTETTEEIVQEVVKGEDSTVLNEMTPEAIAAKKAELQKSLADIEALEKGEEVEVVAEAAAEVVQEIIKGEEVVAEEVAEVVAEVVTAPVVTAPVVEPTAQNEVVKAMTEVFKGELAGVAEANKEKFKAVGMLVKGFQEEVQELRGQVQEMADETPGKKTITKAQVLKKSFDNGEGDDKGLNYVSIKANKSSIAKALTDDFFKGEVQDEKFRKSLLKFDQSSVADPAVVAKAKELGMTLVP